MGECDQFGNINVSKFGGKLSGKRLVMICSPKGCGGFINISQTAKTVVFLGTFTAIGLKVEVVNGNLKILQVADVL